MRLLVGSARSGRITTRLAPIRQVMATGRHRHRRPRSPRHHRLTLAADVPGCKRSRLATIRQVPNFPPRNPAVRPCRVHGRIRGWAFDAPD